MGSHTQVDVFPLLRNCGRDRDLEASSRYTAKWFPYVPKTKKRTSCHELSRIAAFQPTGCSTVAGYGWIIHDPGTRTPACKPLLHLKAMSSCIKRWQNHKFLAFLWAFHWTLSAVLTIFVIFCHCRGHDNWSHCLATNTSCCMLRQNDPVCSGQNGTRTFLKGWNVVSVCPQGAGWSPHACKEWKGENSLHCFSLGANIMAN